MLPTVGMTRMGTYSCTYLMPRPRTFLGTALSTMVRHRPWAPHSQGSDRPTPGWLAATVPAPARTACSELKMKIGYSTSAVECAGQSPACLKSMPLPILSFAQPTGKHGTHLSATDSGAQCRRLLSASIYALASSVTCMNSVMAI